MKSMKVMIGLGIAAIGLVAAGGARAAELPKVLVLGDSISIGYTPPLKKLLEGKAEVVHNPGNAAHSGNGVAKLEEWLGDTRWAVIHFNHGLHDLKWVDDKGGNVPGKENGHIQIPLEDYEKNLETIVQRLEKTGAKLIFATTTPYPDRPDGPLREAAALPEYNAAALRVMRKHGVAIDDLHAVVKDRLGELQRPRNVHFTPQGSQVLAEAVAASILKALGEQP